MFPLLLQAGIIEEMMEDTMESLDDSDDMEEAAQEEVDKVLFELTAGKYILYSSMHAFFISLKKKETCTITRLHQQYT